MFFSATDRQSRPNRAEEADDDLADLARITVEFTAVEPDGLRVEAADVAHGVRPSREAAERLKREAHAASSKPTPA